MAANRLAQEKSPYLLQHAHNPVDWYSWGPEAFEKAKKENKPIFLSIGYSTCHWCHVMERESFENEEIAKLMNEFFVNIKVDREERPDVDHIYMTAIQAMNGQGGWPLSVFLTPALEPFFGGTYFPPDRRYGRPGFPDVLREISRMWREEKQKIADWGTQISQALKDPRDMSGEMLSVDALRQAYHAFKDMYDPEEGGFGGAPKFPRSETLSLLLRIYRRTGEQKALTMVTQTLDKMVRGGIYDHLGGGFHRYSTDAQWLVPHFEKMLYDNALLAKSYLEAYQVDHNEMWASVARETLDYVLRDMTSPEGAFYSAEDADSEGEEGKFYVWTEKELEEILTPEEFWKVREVFQISPLHMNASTPWSVRYEASLSSAMQKLFNHRKKRIPPYKDDKILASWNGLMISSMAFAAQILGEKKYLEGAQKAALFVIKTLWDGKVLKRRYRDGDVRYTGSLDDYAFVIQGLLDLYETDFNPYWLEIVQNMQVRVDEYFWDVSQGGYFSTDSSDGTLLARMKEIYDGALPSGNSVEALNLLRLHAFTGNSDYEKKSEKLFQVFSKFVQDNPQACPSLLMAVDFATDAVKEIVVCGKKEDSFVKGVFSQLRANFLPNKVMSFVSDKETAKKISLMNGKFSPEPRLYICENQQCQTPITDLNFFSSKLLMPKKYGF